MSSYEEWWQDWLTKIADQRLTIKDAGKDNPRYTMTISKWQMKQSEFYANSDEYKEDPIKNWFVV